MTRLIPSDFLRCPGSPDIGMVTCPRRHQCARHEQLKHDGKSGETGHTSTFPGEIRVTGRSETIQCDSFIPSSEFVTQG